MYIQKPGSSPCSVTAGTFGFCLHYYGDLPVWGSGKSSKKQKRQRSLERIFIHICEWCVGLDSGLVSDMADACV